MWNRFKLCLITLVGIQNLYSQCFDEEITVADFPYDHTIEMLSSSNGQMMVLLFDFKFFFVFCINPFTI